MPLSVFCFIHQKKLFYYSYSSKINTEPHLLHKTNRLEIYIYNLKPETKKNMYCLPGNLAENAGKFRHRSKKKRFINQDIVLPINKENSMLRTYEQSG